MTKRISTGQHGGNTWDTEFQDGTNQHNLFKGQRELRRTAEGRKYLVENGVSMKGYQRGQGTYSSIPFAERRFVSWDGEGDNKGQYVLFGNSDGDYVHSPSLSTYECLSIITEKAHIDAIHFGFAFGYDVNMILRDFSPNHLRALKDNGHVRWNKWRVEYLPRKWFMITDRHTKRTVKIWDVWSFFMSSALKAWEEYGVYVSQGVIDGKKSRGSQDYSELHSEIIPYWAEENNAYVALMDKLRESLHAAGLFISAWHGPGAIASHSMAKHKLETAMAVCPQPVNLAAQYAYGGGRFELFRIGRANKKIYEYDVNSAYPYAISQLPNLARGSWIHSENPERIGRFGVYRITFKLNPMESNNMHRPMPFFARDKHGLISFPTVVDTWVWSPELAGKAKNFPGLTIHEGWEFVEDDPSDRPFAWLAENYALRQQYKAAGNRAQYALKLQMNSMYGKQAQRVGWNEEKRTSPKWHQLEWAGWVTSYCRAMVFRAALHAGTGIVAFETDAVFSTVSLADKLDIGFGLGQWEETIYDDFVYLQSGCRFGYIYDKKLGERVWKPKYRGFDPGSLSLDSALEALGKSPDEWIVNGMSSRFIGFAQAMHQKKMETWRTFVTEPRDLRIGMEGKRRHNPKLCKACQSGIPASETFHDCVLSNPIAGESQKHFLPWVDGILDESQTETDLEKFNEPEMVVF